MTQYINIELINDETKDGYDYNRNEIYCDLYRPMIDEDKYPNIMKKAKSHTLSLDDYLDGIIKYFCDCKVNRMVINLEEREMAYTPVKEMTIGEIEKELGYKIKIVKEK